MDAVTRWGTHECYRVSRRHPVSARKETPRLYSAGKEFAERGNCEDPTRELIKPLEFMPRGSGNRTRSET